MNGFVHMSTVLGNDCVYHRQCLALAFKLCLPLGLPLEAVPVLKLESGRDRPAHRLTGAQRRAGHGLAARSLPARAVGNRAMSAA